MTSKPRAKPIAVPESAVRTAEQILASVTVKNGIVWTTCSNCGGTGRYPSSMIPAGQCRFYCWSGRTADTFGKLAYGHAETYVRTQQARDRAMYRAGVRRAAQEKVETAARIEAATRATAARLAFLADRPELAEALRSENTIAKDLNRKLTQYGRLSDAQIALAIKVARPIPAWTEGRQGVEGRIVSIKSEPGLYYGSISVKMLIEQDNGQKLWITMPSALAANEGDRVALTATIQPAVDHYFAYGKRPTKARVIEPAPEADGGKSALDTAAVAG